MLTPAEQYLEHPITKAYRDRYQMPFSMVMIGRQIHSISPRVFEAIDNTIEHRSLAYFPLDDLQAIWMHVHEFDESLIRWMDTLFYLYEELHGAPPFHLNALFTNDKANHKSQYFPSLQHDVFVYHFPFDTRTPITAQKLKPEYLEAGEKRFVEDCIHHVDLINKTMERIHEKYHYKHPDMVIQHIYGLIKKHHPDFQWTSATVLSVKNTRATLLRSSAEWLSDVEKVVAFAAWAPHSNQKDGFQCHASWLIPDNVSTYFKVALKEGIDFTHKTMKTLFNSPLRLDASHPEYKTCYQKVWSNLIKYFRSKSFLTPYRVLDDRRAIDIFDVFTDHEPSYFPLETGLTLLLHPHDGHVQYMTDILTFYGKKQRISSKNSIVHQFATFLEEGHQLSTHSLLNDIDGLKHLQMHANDILQELLNRQTVGTEEAPLYL